MRVRSSLCRLPSSATNPPSSSLPRHLKPSASTSSSFFADQFGGLPEQRQNNIPPPTDGGKPGPPIGVLMNQQASSHNVTSSPMYSTSSPSLESERPYHTSSSAIITLGLSQISFTYEELAFATNGFSNSNLLGRGGFGYVHKGVLPNEKTVAIKQLKSGSRQGEREFQAEVEVISRVHHRHLVSLVGYCIAGTKRMLVYEFVPNNTLEFHLHGKIPISNFFSSSSQMEKHAKVM